MCVNPMNYIFTAMNREYASRIVDTWKYCETYAIYDYVNEADHMLDEEGWDRASSQCWMRKAN